MEPPAGRLHFSAHCSERQLPGRQVVPAALVLDVLQRRSHRTEPAPLRDDLTGPIAGLDLENDHIEAELLTSDAAQVLQRPGGVATASDGGAHDIARAARPEVEGDEADGHVAAVRDRQVEVALASVHE